MPENDVSEPEDPNAEDVITPSAPDDASSKIDNNEPAPASHHSHSTTVITKPEQKPNFELRCNCAEIDLETAADLCDALTKYFPTARQISREEFAGFIWATLTKDSKTILSSGSSSSRYCDMDGSAYVPYVEGLSFAGVFSGCGSQRFAPKEELTMAQMIVTLCRFTTPKEYTLGGIDIAGHWAEPAIKTAVSLSWLNDEPFDLQKPVTMGDFTAFLSAIIKAAV